MTPQPELELEMELEPESPETPAELELEIEEDAEPVAEAAVTVTAQPLVEVLPAEFQLPTLIRFVPDVRLRQAADDAATRALAVDVAGPEGLAKADAALVELRDAISAAEGSFQEPAEIANKLHKHITGMRAEWIASPTTAKKTVDARVVAETLRLKRIADEEARKAQEKADADARADAKREADAAAKSNAPAAVVEEMKRKAETTTAAPVPRPVAAPVMRSTTTVVAWKARIKGTPGDADANPDMDQLTPVQKAQVLLLMADVIAGKQPITCFEIAWSRLNARAKGEKSTMEITGIEAFEQGSARAKGRRS